MFDPVKASKNIKEEMISYIATTFSFADAKLRKQFESQLNEMIAKGPYLEINDIFLSGKSINDLIDDGVLSRYFIDLESKKPDNDRLNKKILPIHRPLYKHQEEAIKKIVDGNNVVISTGTGSGKTNCFLIPVINELLREKEAGTLGAGIRALFIYPMNALANDQLKNIRKLLMEYEDITFGVYNGGTENEEKTALKLYESMYAAEPIEKLRKPLKNELLSREEMKKTPPNILFTNYAMLEHLLFRPKDDVLFSNSDFKFVVLDEAHIYSGATGIETSILLRRLRARISASRETQFILTSATLGVNNESDDDIVLFANNLCGVCFKKENIIKAKREKYVSSEQGTDYSFQLISELADEKNSVSEVLDRYGIRHENKSENELIYDFIVSSKQYQLFRQELKNVTLLQDIETILHTKRDECTAFISLCSRAQKGGKALLDARYHFFVRSLEGCFIELSNDRNIFLNRKKTYYNYAVFEIALCSDCGRYSLVGKIEDGRLIQTSKTDEKIEFFYLAEDTNKIIDDEDDEETEETEETEKTEVRYYLCPHCGAIVEENRIKNRPCDCNEKDYITIIKSKHSNNGNKFPKCDNCHRGRYNRFYLGNDAATSVLATSLYEELPEQAYKEVRQTSQTAKMNIFARAMAQNRKAAKKTGRQFLVFSDSRQEAAKFACYLGKSYDEFLRRRGICHIIQEEKSEIIKGNYSISDFVTKLTAYFSNKRSFASSNSDNSNLTIASKKNAWVAMLNELARSNSPTSLTSLGVIQFEYMGNNEVIIRNIADIYEVDYQSAKNLLNLLAFEIVKKGAICPDSDTDIDDNDREYIFYTPSQKFLTALQSIDNKKKPVNDWFPHEKKNKKNEYYITNKMNYVMNCLHLSESDAASFLKDYWTYLIDSENNEYCMIQKNNDNTFVLPAKHFRVRIFGDENAKWYKCPQCGRISPYHIHERCITVNCNARVEEVNPEVLRANNHFSNLYYSDRMSPLFIKEHTAQLSKHESTEYQEQFVKKEINALSCSTTFEMGVDVGDLETVFLRDVPPLPANYVQRAGRAGRSVNAAAYCLTYAKLSSHDLSFFREPENMIKGRCLPPLFKVDNEKIVKRHIYAVALSMFFSMKPDLYNHNDASKFINEKGYIEFLQWLDEKPSRLVDMLLSSIPDNNNLHMRLGIKDYGWLEEFKGENGVFTTLIREYENNIKQFDDIIAQFKANDDSEKVAKCDRKKKHYMSNKLIDFLARGNILPRYGFPVDTVELEQNTTATNINKLRLSRDLSIAIAEYAPSSEVVADGKLYTSRYIKKSNIMSNGQKEWKTAYLGICKNELCQAINYSVTPIVDDSVLCNCCKEPMSAMDFFESIEPISGFVTEREAKEVPLSKQEKNYKSEDVYIKSTASKENYRMEKDYNGIKITVQSTTNDSLMVKSLNNFYVCPKCGYALAEDETIAGDNNANKNIKNKAHKITTTKKHESLYGQYQCDCTELKKYSLHHVFNTDVAKISFACDTSDKKTMLSTMYAILYAICDHLNIERRDIKACLSWNLIQRQIKYSIIIYDAVPGGAGHSRRLVTDDGKMLETIMRKALKNMKSCNCDPSCYNCLRSYENQKIHEDLDRKRAAKFLSQFFH